MSYNSRTRTTGTYSSRSRTLKDHLSAADAFTRLSAHANRLQSLQAILDTVLPANLLPGTRIANLKRGKVVIHTDSGAVAVKLRQLAPRLAESFLQQEQEVTGIEVRVQAWRLAPGRIRPKQPMVIGARPKLALTSLISGLEEGSPIRRAVERLLKNTR